MEEDKTFKCSSCVKENNEKINAQRFIDKLDSYFATNDLDRAKEHLLYWEQEARNIGDKCGLLTVLNEKIGFSRRIGDEQMAMSAVSEAKDLIDEKRILNNPSGAVICTNIATTLKEFNHAEEGLPLYDLAEKVYINFGMDNSYEYAAMLNNKATALSSLQRYEEGENCLNKAMEILKKEGVHEAEISVSLVNLAHIVYEREKDIDKVNSILDKAWDCIISTNQLHDGNYAYTLTKCSPTFRFFGREMEADALDSTADEIYGEE